MQLHFATTNNESALSGLYDGTIGSWLLFTSSLHQLD